MMTNEEAHNASRTGGIDRYTIGRHGGLIIVYDDLCARTVARCDDISDAERICALLNKDAAS